MFSAENCEGDPPNKLQEEASYAGRYSQKERFQIEYVICNLKTHNLSKGEFRKRNVLRLKDGCLLSPVCNFFCSFTVKVMGPKKGGETIIEHWSSQVLPTGQCVKLVGKEHLFEINCCLRNFAWHLCRQLHRLKLRCWRAAKLFIKTKLSQIESMRWHFFVGNHEWLVNQPPLIPPRNKALLRAY